MNEKVFSLVVGVLATWRVTHLLHSEDGPADVFVRLRRAAGAGFLGSLLDCFYCLSLWVAAPFAIGTGTSWLDRAMLWLALSGGACLLERLKPNAPAAIYAEDTEETNALLREQTSAVGATPDPRSGTSPSDGPGGASAEPTSPSGRGAGGAP